MRYADARSELIRRLEAAGLDPAHLDPWEAWKVFKAYLRVPLDEVDGGVRLSAARCGGSVD